MAEVSSAARSRIRRLGKDVRRIRQAGIPFDVPLGVPIANPRAEKQLLFKSACRVAGVSLEDVREGVMFADYAGFMDMQTETYSRRARTRHFVFNPFTKKLEETLGRISEQAGKRAGASIAAFMGARLGLVTWDMSEDPSEGPDVATVRAGVKSRYFGGHFIFRIRRDADGVVLEDDWLPEGGADLRAASLAMGTLVLGTHPLGFEQIAERVVHEIVRAQDDGRPYVGEIGPPAKEEP